MPTCARKTVVGAPSRSMNRATSVANSVASSSPPPASSQKSRPSGRGVGRSTAKRHRKILRDNIQGVTKADIRRLARRGGTKRISQDVYGSIRLALREFLQEILRVANEAVQYHGQKTVTVHDVVWALNKKGRGIYGFGHYN